MEILRTLKLEARELNVEQIAAATGVARRTAQKWLRSDSFLRWIDEGRVIRFNPADPSNPTTYCFAGPMPEEEENLPDDTENDGG